MHKAAGEKRKKHSARKMLNRGGKALFCKDLFQDAAAVGIGSFLYAMSFNAFLLPGNIVLGGVSGVAVAAQHAWGVNPGGVILLLNIPLFCLSWFTYGFRFCLRALIGTVSTAAAIEVLTFFPVTLTDPLLCCVFGAVVMGIGTGILFSRGFTTGGTDHLVWFLRRRFPGISMGNTVLLVDAAVVLISAWLMGSYESIFYSALGIFVFSYVVQLVQNGAHGGEMVWIVSPCARAIADRICRELQRGVTMVRGRGFYSGKAGEMVLCAIRKNEFYQIRRIVRECDAGAFVIVLDVTQVFGLGFETPGGDLPAAKDGRDRKRGSADHGK